MVEKKANHGISKIASQMECLVIIMCVVRRVVICLVVKASHEAETMLELVLIDVKNAQQSVQADGAVRCQVAGCMHNGVYSICADHANPPHR